MGVETLAARQSGESIYYWNLTIAEGTSADTGVMEQWLSYVEKSGVICGAGVDQYSRHVKETDDAFSFDDEAWDTIFVLGTQPLPYVAGELAV